MARRLRKKSTAKDLDLLPVMNLFSILIPFLLSVAVFQKLAIVDVFLPERSEMKQTASAAPPETGKLNLTIALTDNQISIWSRSAELPAVFAREFITYRCRNDNDTLTVDSKLMAQDPDRYKCSDGRTPGRSEVEKIHMLALNRTSEEDEGELIPVIMTADDYVLLLNDYSYVQALDSVNVGAKYLLMRQVQTFEVNGSDDEKQTVRENSVITMEEREWGRLKVGYLSVYDALYLRLYQIQNHDAFTSLPDIKEIVVLSDDNVIYDKVISVMDAARDAGFTRVQLAKLDGG
jgi:biopolymer transport protein ExbD